MAGVGQTSSPLAENQAAWQVVKLSLPVSTRLSDSRILAGLRSGVRRRAPISMETFMAALRPLPATSPMTTSRPPSLGGLDMEEVAAHLVGRVVDRIDFKARAWRASRGESSAPGRCGRRPARWRRAPGRAERAGSGRR